MTAIPKPGTGIPPSAPIVIEEGYEFIHKEEQDLSFAINQLEIAARLMHEIGQPNAEIEIQKKKNLSLILKHHEELQKTCAETQKINTELKGRLKEVEQMVKNISAQLSAQQEQIQILQGQVSLQKSEEGSCCLYLFNCCSFEAR
jgi:hypothetical protein